jgi:hypothetical protein
MKNTTFNHEFDLGDTAVSKMFGNVEVMGMEYIKTQLSSNVVYRVRDATASYHYVSDTDLIQPITQTSTLPPTSSTAYVTPISGTYAYSGVIVGTSGAAGSINLTLPKGLTFDPTFGSDPVKVPAKCECGAEAVGSSSHSSWCGKHNSFGLGV